MITTNQDENGSPLPPESSLVQVKTYQSSGTIILDRPEKCNALSRTMISEIVQAFEDLHQEPKVRAVILTGAGAAFCAGLDLAEMHATLNEQDAWRQWREDAVRYRELIDVMLRFPKPIIAAVNGPALAAGAGLVLASDMVVAGPQASFGFPESKRGLVAGLTAPLLVFRIGAGRAANLLLTAENVDAETSHRIGVFHELVAHEQVWARAHEMAALCAESAHESLLMTKRLLNETIGEHLGVLLSAGAAASATSRTTEAAAEGIAAFLKKREPRWSQ